MTMGLFLSTLKLVSRYDPKVLDHLEFVAKLRGGGGRMQAHYIP